MARYVGGRIVPTHGGVWDGSKTYEELTIVLREDTGDSYISKLPVPAGTAITEEHYWALCQQFSEQMKLFRDGVDQDVLEMQSLTSSTVRNINKSLEDTEESIAQKLADTEEAVEERTLEAESKLAAGRAAMEASAASLNARMDGIVAGSTGEGDVEIADIRTDSSGKNYATAGDAVRSITAGLPEKLELKSSNAIKSGDNVSTIEVLNRTAHYSFVYTGTGYVGGFVRLGEYADLKGKCLMAIYQNNGAPVNGTVQVVNSMYSWGSLDGSVVAKTVGKITLGEENYFYQEMVIDFNSEDLDSLLELKPEGTFYLDFKQENAGTELSGEVYFYVYDLDETTDLFWKYYAGSERLRHIMAEVISARTDTRGIAYDTIGERLNLMDSFIVPSLRISSVVGSVDNNHNGLYNQEGFRGVNHTFSGTVDFDFQAYMALENYQWSSLHAYLLFDKEMIRGLHSYDDVILKVRLDGLGENLHIGENQLFRYYVNVVGSWARTVNALKSVTLKIGEENIIPITRSEIENVLNDPSSGFYIVPVLNCLNNSVIEDMGQIRITFSLSNSEHASLDGFTTYVDMAETAMRANYASEAGTAVSSENSDRANYASGAGTAVMADNFFINSPEDLLNEAGVIFSRGMDTLDIPTEPLVDMRAGGQTCIRFEQHKTVEGIHQRIDMTMQLGAGTSQSYNQGYQKILGSALPIPTIMQKFVEGYLELYVASVEDCENYPEGTSTGAYSQKMLIATTISGGNDHETHANEYPIVKRPLGNGKKLYVWKMSVETEKAQQVIDEMNAGTRTSYWNGIWNTRACTLEEPVTWNVTWYWLDYAFTDGSFTDEDMADYFIKKYMYWGSNVNHYLLAQRFAVLGEIEESVSALEADVEDLKERVPIPDTLGPKIVCWGDSLTAGGGWTTTLADLSGGTVYNGGTGGENARTIMARQGADVMTINNITIPAVCEPVTIATRTDDKGILTEGGYKVTPLLQGGAHVNPVMIGEVEGTLRWTGSNYADQTGTWTFTRSEPGEEVVIDRPTAIRTNFDRIHNEKNEIMVIFMGQNGGYSSIDDLIDMHRKMIDHFKGKEYVILGLSSGTAAQRADYEAAMKNAFGRRFISLREYLAAPIYDEDGNIISCYGLADQGLEPGTKEYNGVTYVALEEIAIGVVPHQIISDSVHYTAGTKTVIGEMLYRKMKELNIL